MRRLLTTRRGDERGSLIVATMIILVVFTLGTAMAYRVIGAESIVLSTQNSASAVSLADAGVADALFRLDQGPAGTGSGSYFCVKAGDSNCAASAVPGAPGVSYVATQVSASQWTVKAMAVSHNGTAAVQETVTRTPSYPFALFGNTSLTFNGDASAAFSTYSSSSPISSASGNPNPNSGGDVAIGSNGTITCNGGLGSNVEVAYYGTGGVGSIQDSSCGSYQKFTTKYYLAPPTAPSGSSECPNLGQLGSGIPGAPTTLAAGTYLCTIPVTISGTLDVGGPVSLYIILDPSVYNSTTSALTIIRGSYVNDQADYCANGGSGACSPKPDLPNSQDLQIFSNSTGTFGNDNGQGYYFGGIIYAPDASLTGDGCKSQYYGSLVINTLTCNGGPHLAVSYDSSLSSLYGPWTPGGYTQIDPSSVTIP